MFGYLIPTLAAVVGANVQGTSKPLIETHRVSLCAFLVATIFYCIALAADYKSQHNQAKSSQFCGLIAVISGSLSAISLISTFFTNSIAEILLYNAWSCAAIIIVVYQYGRKFMVACHWLYEEILRPFFCNTLYWLQANIKNKISSIEQQQLPAV